MFSGSHLKEEAMTDTNLAIGILAPVDAGKTTLSEAIMFISGSIRKMGRVDHQDAFLDTFALERKRGITIFSKQACFTAGGRHFTLLDTPGHADFSPEMERTLQVLDAAVLVISAADGVTGQVRVLWSLLGHYRVPTVIFVNKMDQNGMDGRALYDEIIKTLGPQVTVFPEKYDDPQWLENAAVCDENAMEKYLESGKLSQADVSGMFCERKLFPCFFGSALKLDGVKELMDGLVTMVRCPDYRTGFAARVFKITRDADGVRETWMKITGGNLRVKDTVSRNGEAADSEKADQIRVYSGSRYEAVQQAEAGCICAVTGLKATHAGDGLGEEKGGAEGLLQPILNCRIIPDGVTDPFTIWKDLQMLEEEEPELHSVRNEKTGDIHVRIMGQVQMEMIRYEMQSRFGINVEFGPADIVYRETIAAPVEGVGHFEPLRHYAEVHLMLEPTGPGSGLTFDSDCSADELDRNWQKLVISSLEAKQHAGVLTGSQITDMKITLVAGRASVKHTEGGDFREASWRAVRQGLMMAESVLLEPVLSFRLELPPEGLGRALNDITRMNGTAGAPEISGASAVLNGTIPAACLGNYAAEISSYTRGEGRLFTALKGYEPCHDPEEVIKSFDYIPELDAENPSSSVFCSHGAGTIVPWDMVREYMHVESSWKMGGAGDRDIAAQEYEVGELQAFRGKQLSNKPDTRTFRERERDRAAEDKELMAIFERTYGPVKPRYTEADEPEFPEESGTETARGPVKPHAPGKPKTPLKEYLLVDGYNVLFASEELKGLAQKDLKAARDRLMDILSDFQGSRSEVIILVFDAYRVAGGQERVLKYHNLNVVYTKEAETADQYIEKAAHEMQKKYSVTVATSDNVEQVIVFGSTARRLSARDFWEEIKLHQDRLRSDYLGKPSGSVGNYVLKES